MKVFCSGSCRLLTTINTGRGLILPVHSMFHNFAGVNFMGKLHNVKQHIQFIKYALGKIQLPKGILKKFLTSYSDKQFFNGSIENPLLIPHKLHNIKTDYNICEAYIFEICSIKIYTKKGFQVQSELTDEYATYEQKEDELYADLMELCNLIPKNKKIVFMCHFRPNIIHNDPKLAIPNRELIFNTLNKFKMNKSNVIIIDPSLFLKDNKKAFDGNLHFTKDGHAAFFNYLINQIKI